VAEHRHHVVPKSKGGTRTISLCAKCHAKVHGKHLLKTSALTRMAIGKKKQAGERVGEIPFGYQLAADSVMLVECEKEQAVIQTIQSLREQGLSLRAIAAKLDSAGLAAKKAKRWNALTISNILKRVA
jgi:DNA invertase Pin-like site-specific DNA recombinase